MSYCRDSGYLDIELSIVDQSTGIGSLILCLYPESVVELEEYVGEIWVEETVENGVGAAGGDSDQVADEVCQHHGLCKCGRI